MNNTYYLVRHGESLKNIEGFESSWPEKRRVPLTEKGIKEAEKAAKQAKNKKIDLIFASDLLRTAQTAEIISEATGVKVKKDKRLREVGLGIFNGMSHKNYGPFWNFGKKLTPLQHYKNRFKIPAPGGESYKDVEDRLKDFLKETENNYKRKNIVVVSHSRPLTMLERIVHKYSFEKFVKIIMDKKEIKMGELKKL
jgi:broad specificity phosphatase PhoE